MGAETAVLIVVLVASLFVLWGALGTSVSVTAGNVAPPTTQFNYVDMIAGEVVTAGMIVYRSPVDGRAYKAITTNSTTAAAVGITIGGAAAGQTVRVMTSGIYTVGGTVAPGVVYTVDDTAGTIRPNADNGSGDFITVIGIGQNTTQIKIGIIHGGVAL